jgi:hypothetical protein
MKFVLIAALLLAQFGPRTPLTPAETLLEPAMLKAINDEPTSPIGIHTINGAMHTIDGTEAAAGTILLTCALDNCQVALQAAQKLNSLIASKRIPRPARTIHVTAVRQTEVVSRTRAAIHVEQSNDRPMQVIRGPWSTAGITDEVVELFSKQGGYVIETLPYEDLSQLGLEAYGIPTTTIVANLAMPNQPAASVAAASAYFLATLPNAGAEALLSHLTVGAHARLAEDGRKAVAQMGNQQRASADVLIMFGQAIEREQRRMRSFERFMASPVDPMLHSRIVDMEKGITSVWTSMGITSSPFVPAAERIRGRGGDDRRVPTRTGTGPLPRPEPPTAFLKFPNADVVIAELGNFIDGKRTISDIRDAVSAEFTSIALPVVSDYFDRLAKAGAISLR